MLLELQDMASKIVSPGEYALQFRQNPCIHGFDDIVMRIQQEMQFLTGISWKLQQVATFRGGTQVTQN